MSDLLATADRGEYAARGVAGAPHHRRSILGHRVIDAKHIAVRARGAVGVTPNHGGVASECFFETPHEVVHTRLLTRFLFITDHEIPLTIRGPIRMPRT